MSNKPEIKFIKRNRKKEDIKEREEHKKVELEELSNKIKSKKNDTNVAGTFTIGLLLIIFIFLGIDWGNSSSPYASYESHGNINGNTVRVVSNPKHDKKSDHSSAEEEKFVIPALLLAFPIALQSFLDCSKELTELRSKKEKIKQS